MLLADALNEPVFVTIDGERRKIIKREAVVHQLVNKFATADLRAIKMIEMFDALFSLAPGLSAKQNGKRSDELMATALERSRKDV